MGFNKRFVSTDLIKFSLQNNNSLKDLFKSDAFIFMDDMSYSVYKMYHNGMTENEIKTFLNGKLTNY